MIVDWQHTADELIIICEVPAKIAGFLILVKADISSFLGDWLRFIWKNRVSIPYKSNLIFEKFVNFTTCNCVLVTY